VTSPRLIRAAGCIVWRHGSKEPEIVLVHRPRWNDWSFPKGKLNRGESQLAGAIREVAEETGLVPRLGPRLPDQGYVVNGSTPKVVAYWAAQPPRDADLSTYTPNAEIDDVQWVRLSKARSWLDYPRDAELLDSFAESAYDSQPLIVVRHAHARSRKTWRTDDSDRPLKVEGIRQSQRLISLLGAYGVTRVISSDSERCVDTVLPYVNARRKVKLTLDASISEEGANRSGIRRRVGKALASHRRIAICSHRPVLPTIFETLGLEPISLEPGALVVVHRSKGKVVGTEVLPS
jgi:8-oxo-dGTP pyrophosphatase MutT (NUDIX family)/phosphohistidine phosphatase SixA